MLTQQYHLVTDARERMLEHFSRLPDSVLILESEPFPKKSIRNLLVHIVNVYLFWLEGYLKNRPVTFFQDEDINTVDQAREAFGSADASVRHLIEHYSDQLDQLITNPVPGYDFSVTTTPLKVFTHVFTHEFHHKGQIMTRSRKLGYPPPDTDVVHFEAFES